MPVAVDSDVMAERALRVIQCSGRRVPEDVAIVGNDDLGIAANSDPPLTTVAQPVTEMARSLVVRCRPDRQWRRSPASRGPPAMP